MIEENNNSIKTPSAKSIEMKKYFEEHPEAKQQRSESMKKLWRDPQYRKTQSESIKISCKNNTNLRIYRSERMKQWWKDPKHVEFQSKRQTKLANDMWADPEMRNTLIKSNTIKWNNLEIRSKYCKSSRKRWEDPNEREKAKIAQQKRFEDPNERLKISISLKKFASDPIVRKQISKRVIKSFKEKNIPEKMSIVMKEKFKDPEFKKESLSKSHSPDALKKLSGSLKKGYKEHPEWGELISKNQKNWMSVPEHCPTWKGGVSFFPYCPKFNKKLKRNVRNFFGNKCVLCKITRDEYFEEFIVHHVFTEKMACCESKIEEMNLIRDRLPKNIARFGEEEFSDEEIMYIRMMVPLCRKCHGKQNAKSEQLPYEETTHRRFFTELILNEYGGKCYSEETQNTIPK